MENKGHAKKGRSEFWGNVLLALSVEEFLGQTRNDLLPVASGPRREPSALPKFWDGAEASWRCPICAIATVGRPKKQKTDVWLDASSCRLLIFAFLLVHVAAQIIDRRRKLVRGAVT